MTGTLKLSKPIFVDGQEVDSLDYDFDAMTARQKIEVSADMARVGMVSTTVEEFDSTYHLCLFAKAVEIATKGKATFADVLRMPAKDAQRAGELARDFFYITRVDSSGPESSAG